MPRAPQHHPESRRPLRHPLFRVLLRFAKSVLGVVLVKGAEAAIVSPEMVSIGLVMCLGIAIASVSWGAEALEEAEG